MDIKTELPRELASFRLASNKLSIYLTLHLCILVPAPYFRQFSEVVQKMYFFGAFFRQILLKCMPEVHPLKVLFRTNLLSNIIAQNILCQICTFLVQIRCMSNKNFSWTIRYIFFNRFGFA